MATFILNENDIRLPGQAWVDDVLVFGNDAYRLYKDPRRGLRMYYLGDAQAYLAQESEAVALANEMRLALSGPLADLERQNMAAIAEAELADLEMTQAAACGGGGW